MRLRKEGSLKLGFQDEINTVLSDYTDEERNMEVLNLLMLVKQVQYWQCNRSTPSPDKGQRAGKAPMISEETPKKSKEQILQEEASLAEAIRLDTLLERYMLGSDLQGEDFAKKMVDLKLEEFDEASGNRLISFAPINFEATKASLKRFGEELQTKTTKRLKDDEAKDAEPAKKSGKRRKQMARKGLHTDLDKDDSEGSDEVSEQGHNGMDGPEDELEKVFWKYLKNMFKEPLSTDPIWSLKYPLSAEICKTMLNKKLQGGKPDEDCYKMLKMMEKQAGAKGLTSLEQTATVFSQPLDNAPLWWPKTDYSRRDANWDMVSRRVLTLCIPSSFVVVIVVMVTVVGSWSAPLVQGLKSRYIPTSTTLANSPNTTTAAPSPPPSSFYIHRGTAAAAQPERGVCFGGSAATRPKGAAAATMGCVWWAAVAIGVRLA
ncbi:hypothetical protein Tco_0706668 [Tanacetum coccineum]|uniref:Uncharacterized protein n=1 Tax=Tanacetum coccineum TaxID=301880 RepID=A0ABQ4YA94_9ASTR